jgi:hypothetical protein
MPVGEVELWSHWSCPLLLCACRSGGRSCWITRVFSTQRQTGFNSVYSEVYVYMVNLVLPHSKVIEPFGAGEESVMPEACIL